MAGNLGDLYARLKLDTSSLDGAIAKTRTLGQKLQLSFTAASAAITGVGAPRSRPPPACRLGCGSPIS
jgi:hypothetical protein